MVLVSGFVQIACVVIGLLLGYAALLWKLRRDTGKQCLGGPLTLHRSEDWDWLYADITAESITESWMFRSVSACCAEEFLDKLAGWGFVARITGSGEGWCTFSIRRPRRCPHFLTRLLLRVKVYQKSGG